MAAVVCWCSYSVRGSRPRQTTRITSSPSSVLISTVMVVESGEDSRRNRIPPLHSNGCSIGGEFQMACWTRGKTYRRWAVDSATRATPPTHGGQSDFRLSSGTGSEFRHESWYQDPGVTTVHSSRAVNNVVESATSTSGKRPVRCVPDSRPSLGRCSRPPNSLPRTSLQSHRGLRTTRSSAADSMYTTYNVTQSTTILTYECLIITWIKLYFLFHCNGYGLKCTLVASHAAVWWVALSMRREVY